MRCRNSVYYGEMKCYNDVEKENSHYCNSCECIINNCTNERERELRTVYCLTHLKKQCSNSKCQNEFIEQNKDIILCVLCRCGSHNCLNEREENKDYCSTHLKRQCSNSKCQNEFIEQNKDIILCVLCRCKSHNCLNEREENEDYCKKCKDKGTKSTTTVPTLTTTTTTTVPTLTTTTTTTCYNKKCKKNYTETRYNPNDIYKWCDDCYDRASTCSYYDNINGKCTTQYIRENPKFCYEHRMKCQELCGRDGLDDFTTQSLGKFCVECFHRIFDIDICRVCGDRIYSYKSSKQKKLTCYNGGNGNCIKCKRQNCYNAGIAEFEYFCSAECQNNRKCRVENCTRYRFSVELYCKECKVEVCKKNKCNIIRENLENDYCNKCIDRLCPNVDCKKTMREYVFRYSCRYCGATKEKTNENNEVNEANTSDDGVNEIINLMKNNNISKE